MGDEEREEELPCEGETPTFNQARNVVLFKHHQDELRDLAIKALANERAGHTLQPTDILNEVWLRLFRSRVFEDDADRADLLREAARTIRQILVDHARRRKAQIRGGEWKRVPLDDMLDYCEKKRVDIEAVHEALNDLGRSNQRQATVMTLRFFCGFRVREVAEQLGVSSGTVENDYRLARVWLKERLGDGDADE